MASPRVPTPAGPGVVTRTAFISVHPVGLALDVGDDRAQTASIGASISIRRADRDGRTGAAGIVEPTSPPSQRSASDGAAAEAAERRVASVRRIIAPPRSRTDPGRGHLGQRPVAVAGGQVDRPDRVGRGPSLG